MARPWAKIEVAFRLGFRTRTAGPHPPCADVYAEIPRRREWIAAASTCTNRTLHESNIDRAARVDGRSTAPDGAAPGRGGAAPAAIGRASSASCGHACRRRPPVGQQVLRLPTLPSVAGLRRRFGTHRTISGFGQRQVRGRADDGLDGAIFVFNDLRPLPHTAITQTRSPSLSYPFFFVRTPENLMKRDVPGPLGPGFRTHRPKAGSGPLCTAGEW